MPSSRAPGPLGCDPDVEAIDDPEELILDEGTLCRAPGPDPEPPHGTEYLDPEGEEPPSHIDPLFDGEPLWYESKAKKEVAALQKQLNERLPGTTPLRTDGEFDARTEWAVRMVQWLHDLPVTGVVDRRTRRALPMRALVRSYVPHVKPPRPPQKPSKPPKPAPPPEPKIDEFEIVELVEVVTQDAEKWVKGPANDNTDAQTIKDKVERKDKDGSNFKQFINIGQDVEGQSKRHAEHGREILFKARVKRKSGDTKTLAGAKVEFTYKAFLGPSRKAPAPAGVWKGASLTGDQRAGFGGPGRGAKTTATTDDKGWTSEVSLTVDMYGGDTFEVSAQLTPDTDGGPGTAAKTAAKYVVWRKFWYQLTHRKGFNVPEATKAAAAYGAVAADMLRANRKEFEKTDVPADKLSRTFMPEYMLAQGGSTDEVATIGGHNSDDLFAALKTSEPTQYPGKIHVMVCEYQNDPAGPSGLQAFEIKTRTQTCTLPVAGDGDIISKPSLDGGDLVIRGDYWNIEPAVDDPDNPYSKEPDGVTGFFRRVFRRSLRKLGDITDAEITIDSARATAMDVKVTLPPEVSLPAYVRLELQTCASYLGEGNPPARQILCVYRPRAAAGAAGSEIDYNDTIAHEVGHIWNQTPEPPVVPASVNAHPLQYVGHGGTGSHCRTAAKVAAGAVDWQDAAQETPSPKNGTCIMYHSYSKKCAHVFCDTCKPYLRLQDMTL